MPAPEAFEMRAWLGSIGRRCLESMALRRYTILRRGPLKEDGWLRSLAEGSPVDAPVARSRG